MSAPAANAGPACPLCGGAAPKIFVRAYGDYRLYDCPDCGAGFSDPFRNPGPEYYESNADLYSITIESRPDPTSFEYREGLALLRRELPRGARVLDIGCGAGGFLHSAKEAGFSVVGLDFNPARAQALRERGFDVFNGSLPDFARGGPAPFDAITIFEVIEHLDDPVSWLAQAKALLKPGGLFIVGTPNRNRTFDPFRGPGMEQIDNPPHHLTRWSAASLAEFLSRQGFEVLESRALGIPRPLLCLIARNTLRFGLAVRALDTDQVRHAAASAERAGPRRRLVLLLVAAKEASINAAVTAVYPLFLVARRLFGWQGVALFAAARRPR